ncbi:hypothetical protein ACNQFN_11120 [Thauera butanivorans]|uniref:hypothetical protein n=1 Tax=Thauera butanivorans TaxID=86174 RepID=UPI003AB6C549
MTASTQTMLGAETLSRLADQYFDRLGLDWRRRGRMLDSRDADFLALKKTDARMLAAAEAFTHLGSSSVGQTHQRMADPLTARDLFAATIQAVSTQESSLFAACMAVAGTQPSMGTAFLEAADWCATMSPEATEHAWRSFKPDGVISDIHLLFALASLRSTPRAQSAHVWAKPLLDIAIERHTALAYSLDLARLHGWPQWDVQAEHALTHGDTSVRAAAVRFLLVRGSSRQRQAACHTGSAIACDANPQGNTLVGPLILENNQAASQILTILQRNPMLQNRFTEALAWSGMARAIDWLIPMLDQAVHARHAAEAITLLTGSDPRHDAWLAASPDTSSLADHALPHDRSERDSPWPDKHGFESWWMNNRKNFDPERRYLLGREVDRMHLLQLLHSAPLRWRPMIAWHLQRLDPDCVLITDLPASTQCAYLSRFTESCS